MRSAKAQPIFARSPGELSARKGSSHCDLRSCRATKWSCQRIPIGRNSAGPCSSDFRGPIIFLVLLFSLALCPLLAVIPIHYWGLIRARSGRADFRGETRWKIWHLWYVTALVFVAGTIAAYMFDYFELSRIEMSLRDSQNLDATFSSTAEYSSMSVLMTFGIMLVGTLAVVRQSDWHAE